MPPIEPPRTGRSNSQPVGLSISDINWKSPDKGKLVSFVKERTADHDRRHSEWVKNAKLQLAWASGDQLKIWDNTAHTLVDSYELQADRIALFVNRLKPAVLNFISLVMARPISFRVNPATSEDVDIMSAKVQDKLMRYYWRLLLGDTKFIDALWLMFCTGCVFLKSTWDSNAGPHALISAEDVKMNEEPGPTDSKSRFIRYLAGVLGLGEEDVSLNKENKFEIGQGDLACEILTGFDVIPPKRTWTVEEAPYLIVRQYRQVEEMQRLYGKKAKELNPGFDEAYETYYEIEENAFNRWDTTRLSRSPDHVLTYEIWRPKSLILPEGFHGVICQEKVMRSGANPYSHGEIPVVMLRELPSPKRFWPPSTIQDMMPIQSELNITRSQIAEHKAATVQPRIIAEKGCGLDDLAFTARNEIVEVNPGKIDAVRPWIPEPLPPYISYWESSLRSDFEDASRNHSPSYGKPRSSVTSGKHASTLQEADARLNMPMMRLLRDSLSRVCMQWCAILKQFVAEERVVALTGENQETETLVWSQADMPYLPSNVECSIGPAIDRYTTLELIDMLTARGWLSPAKPEDQYTVFRWLGEGVYQEIDEKQADRTNAALENKMLLRGEQVNILTADDDTTHILEHWKAQKTANFRRALQDNPDLEKIFEIHVIAHVRQRLLKMLRDKVYAAEIERNLAMGAGLLPAPGAAPQQPEAPPERMGTYVQPANRKKHVPKEPNANATF